jgi:hypothetical protein
MQAPRTTLDPQGYYARLGVSPWSTPDTIVAAYRRKARVLHPDVPNTGDAGAFMALKQAYDVLSHAGQRSAYDRSARQTPPTEMPEPGEIGPMPIPPLATPPTRHPKLRDLPFAVWAGMTVVLIVGTVEIALRLMPLQTQARPEQIQATAREVPPLGPAEAPPPAYGPAPVRLAGTPNFYIVPTSSPTMLWRSDEARHALVPWGPLPPFSAVQGMRLFKANGMVEVKVTDSANGFIEASRLTPGDSSAAARAWCTYNAGPTPMNGEVLTRPAVKGPARLSIDNRSGQPAVVKVRAPDGSVIASVFLGPEGQATVDDLPDKQARLDGFAAGMRAQRLADLVAMGPDTRLTIPPDPLAKPVDLPDQTFEME